MSFFGFETTLPRHAAHQKNAPGFAQPHDAFAGLSGHPSDGQAQALNFDDTYDGLGDQLDEADDALNDETFGGVPETQHSVGKDFDFSGQTAKIAGTMHEEQLLFQARQPVVQTTKPFKTAATGYEKYKQTDYIPQLEASASIWGLGPKKPIASTTDTREAKAGNTGGRKMMSLEEVEASMRAQPATSSVSVGQVPPPTSTIPNVASFLDSKTIQESAPLTDQSGHIHILQRPQLHEQPHQLREAHHAQRQGFPASTFDAELPAPPEPPNPRILQRQKSPFQQQQQQKQQPPQEPRPQSSGFHGQGQDSAQPRTILQNPNRLSGHGQPLAPLQRPNQQANPTFGHGAIHKRGPSLQGHMMTTPQQVYALSDQARAQFLAEEAQKAKRNHKIHLMSKDNGFMTPQDKNYITRIQLTSLVSATGNMDSQAAGPEAALAEDFYYQVYTSIRAAPRQKPNQPVNQFTQTYLFATHGRYGRFGGRGHNRSDNHTQRMEQQVQRAVEAAKTKPKNKQLVIEGSLGKISFSNAKTPKPLLNIKRSEPTPDRPSSAAQRRQSAGVATVDRKEALRDIENVYGTLLQLESHERLIPPPLQEDGTADQVQQHMEWRQRLRKLCDDLWKEMRVMDPIIPRSTTPHPFVAFLSYAKGKKAIPRVFRHLDEQQRITILTMIVVHLDQLDVIVKALPSAPLNPLPSQLAAPIRDEIELFSQAVMPALFGYVNDAPLEIVDGLLSLIIERVNVSAILRTKIGLALLTMLISRAELVKQSTPTTNGPAEEWSNLFSRLFDLAEPILSIIFPGSVMDADDIYVWQFLAAMGVGASPDQQQRLVLGVKDRVMETVGVARTLPADLREKRLSEVNLFMRAIGLDVELLG